MFQLKQVTIFLMIKLITALNNFPEILTKSYNQTFNLSSNAILTCHIRDLNDHHVTWFKYDSLTSSSYPLAVGEDLFTTDKRYSVSSYSTSARDSYWSLEIYQLNLSDEGTYLCKISNRRASVSVLINLHIQIPMILSPTYLYVEPGTNVKLNCSILIDNQTLQTQIDWHFLSNHLNKTKFDDVYTRKKTINNSLISYLIIHHAQTYHSGIWTCVYKRQRRTAKLIVEKGWFLFSFHLFSLIIFFFYSDVLERQRISALLSNNSNRQTSLINLFLLLFIINYFFI